MRYLFLIGWLSVVLSQQVSAERKNPIIEVITSDRYPMTGINAIKNKGIQVTLYNFDDGQRMVKKLEANLPIGQKAAEKAMAKRLKKIGNTSLQAMFFDAFQANVIGTEYGITQYPAIVFDKGQSVVYGETDLPNALVLYRRWKKKAVK